MRKNSRNQLLLFMFIAWVFGTGLLTATMCLTHDVMTRDDILIILVTSLGSAGFMIQLVDFYDRYELNQYKKRLNKENRNGVV